jgi:hypothetical protein
MENVLVHRLTELTEAYEAALWKCRLIEQGITTKSEYQKWYESQPHHEQTLADRRRELASSFLGSYHASEAEKVYQIQRSKILWTETNVLWALRVVIGDTHPPADTLLTEFVAEVATYTSPSTPPSFSHPFIVGEAYV